MGELKEINETLKKIENKIEDKSLSRSYFKNFIDFGKIQEELRKKRDDERNEEILEIQKMQIENSKIQIKSIKKQEKFAGFVAFTGGILALVSIYSLIMKITPLENYPVNYLVINIVFLLLIVLCLGPLTKFIINFWRGEIFKKDETKKEKE